MNAVMSNSECIATVAGTAGMQAISIDKKVINFANTDYGGSDLVLNASNGNCYFSRLKEFSINSRCMLTYSSSDT